MIIAKISEKFALQIAVVISNTTSIGDRDGSAEPTDFQKLYLYPLFGTHFYIKERQICFDYQCGTHRLKILTTSVSHLTSEKWRFMGRTIHPCVINFQWPLVSSSECGPENPK